MERSSVFWVWFVCLFFSKLSVMSAVFQFSRRERASFNPARLKRKSLATQSKYPPPLCSDQSISPFCRGCVAFRRRVQTPVLLSAVQPNISLLHSHLHDFFKKKEEIMFMQDSNSLCKDSFLIPYVRVLDSHALIFSLPGSLSCSLTAASREITAGQGTPAYSPWSITRRTRAHQHVRGHGRNAVITPL